MVTLVWRTDLHLADIPPRSRTDNWADTLIDKVRQIGVIAEEENASAVIDGGDFFHVKAPSRNSHRLVVQAAEAHGAYPCPVYACVGNHDCKYGDYTLLHEQPLGVLYESGVFRRLYDQYEAHISDAEVNVRVVGVPYHGTQYDMSRIRNVKKGEEDYLVVVAHLLASPSGGSMFEGEDIVKYSDLSGLDGDVYAFGHWHKDQGVVEIADSKYVVNIGSLSRGSLSQDELSRTPSVAVINLSRSGIEIAQRPLDVIPPDEVFDLEGKLREDIREESVEAFVGSIKETLEDSQKDDVPDIIRSLPDVPSSVSERAILYWEESV